MALDAHRARPSLAWGVWAALLVADLLYVAVFGDEVPFWDDWIFVPQLTGGRPITGSWLWSLHNEHRIAIPRLLHLGAVQLAGGDLRAPLVLNVLLVAAASAALLVAIGRWRGRTVLGDATLPILLMHPGHGELFVWGIGLASSASTFLVAATIACIVSGGAWSAGRAAIVGLCLVGLGLCGAGGLALVPPLLCWLGWAMWSMSVRARVTAGILAVLAVVAWTASLVGFVRPAVHPASAGIVPALRTALECLAMSLGPSGRTTWPLSGLTVLVAIGGATLVLVRAVALRPDERARASGLLAALAAFVGLALVVGWGRSGFGAGAGLATRYALLGAPALAVAYLATALLPARSARTSQALFLALACAALPYDVKAGLDDGRLRRTRGTALQADVGAGRSPHDIATRHAGAIYPEPVVLEQGLALLRMARLGPYRRAAVPGRRFPMFTSAPDAVWSDVAVEPQALAGEDGLLVHAPGMIRLHVGPGAQMLTVRFGIQPGAWTSGETDGVEFTGALVASGAERPLFRVALDPRYVADDRGMHDVTVRIDAPHDGDVVLRTDPGPGGDSRWDWSVWTAIALRPDR